MAFIIWGGIAIFCGIIFFILDKWVCDDATCTDGFAGFLAAVAIFLAGILISSIIVECKYADPHINREYFEQIDTTVYNLEIINNDNYVLYNMGEKTVNFIYYKDGYPVINNANDKEVNIYTYIEGEPARVIVTHWQPKSAFARSLDKSHYEHTTYDIYLASEELLMSGNP